MTSSRRCRSGHLRHGRLLDRRRAPVFDLVHQIYSHRHDHVCKQNHNKCHQIKSHQFKSNQIESHRIESNQLKSIRFLSNWHIKSNQIKSQSNRITNKQIHWNTKMSSISLLHIQRKPFYRCSSCLAPKFTTLFNCDNLSPLPSPFFNKLTFFTIAYYWKWNSWKFILLSLTHTRTHSYIDIVL